MHVTKATAGFIGVLFLMSVARAQNAGGGNDGERSAGDARQRRALASAIASARESAGSREWDDSSRESLVSRLSSLQLAELQVLAQEGAPPDVGALLGNARSDLVFTPIPPCRAVNTIAAGGPIVVPPGGSATRNFVIRGSLAGLFAAQGGVPCNIPFSAAAIAVNYTVASPSAPGHVIVEPAHPGSSNTSVLNFSPAPAGLNLANGVITPLCDFALSACNEDIRVTVAFGSTHFLVDVTGYFAPPASGCGSVYVAVPNTACPGGNTPTDFPPCDQVVAGAYCETDGECGLDDNLNNCPGSLDVFVRVR